MSPDEQDELEIQLELDDLPIVAIDYVKLAFPNIKPIKN